MSGEYVRSATSRQERDTSGECWRCAYKDKRIANLEAENDAWAEKWLAERNDGTEKWLAEHEEKANLKEAAKAVVESARKWSSPNYPTFDRIESGRIDALAALIQK